MPARLLLPGSVAELRCIECGQMIEAVVAGDPIAGVNFADLVEAFAFHPCTRLTEFPRELTHPGGRSCRDYTYCCP